MSKLSPELQQSVLDRARSGESHVSIAAWISEQIGERYTRQSVAKLVQKHTGAVADTNKIIARTHASERLEADLDSFESEDAKLAEAYALALDQYLAEPSQVNAGNLARIGNLRLSSRAQRFKVSGLDQPDEQASTLSELLKRPAAT